MKFELNLVSLGTWSVVAAGAAIPLSVTATSIFIFLSVMAELFSGGYRRNKHIVINNPVVQVALLLFAWLTVSLLYTSAPLYEALRFLEKYRELLLIALLLPLFMEEKWRRRGLNAFIAAMLITLFLSYLKYFGLIEFGTGATNEGTIFKHRITQNVLMSLTGLWVTLQLLNGSRRWLWGIILALITYNIFFQVGGRIGYIIFPVLILMLIYRRFGLKKYLATGTLFILLFTLLFVTSDIFHQRVALVSSNIEQYLQGQYTTSTALRLSFYKNTLELIYQKPWLGYGIGSFSQEYAEHIKGSTFPATSHPHNEYLLIGEQSGIVGVILFVYLLIKMWLSARCMPDNYAIFMQGIVLTMAIGCMFNSFLLDSVEGHIFAFITALCCATWSPPLKKHPCSQSP